MVEYRYTEAKPHRAPNLVAELVQLNVEAIVSPDRPSIRAAGQATKTIPIIMVTQGDPVTDGFVESLARPRGNITGVTRLTRELSGKRLELFKEIIQQYRVSESCSRTLPQRAAPPKTTKRRRVL